MAQSITASELRTNFNDFVNRTAYAGERFIVHRYGKPIAVMVTLEDLRRIEEIKAALQSGTPLPEN